MRLLLSVIFASGVFLCQGQPPPTWYTGVLVLANDDVLTGEIYFQPSTDVVLLKSSGKVDVIPAYKINLFRFYDRVADINRQFVCIPKDYRRYQILEVVVQGAIKILRYPRSGMSTGRDEVGGYHYLVWDGAVTEAIEKFNRRVYPKLVESYPTELMSFIRNHRLNLADLKSTFLIIKEYNRLVQTGPVMAQL